MQPPQSCTTIAIHVKELLSDITGYCNSVAEGYKSTQPGNEPDVSLTEDVLEDENMSLTERTIHRLITECMLMLRPFTKVELQARYKDNLQKHIEQYVMLLRFNEPRDEIQVSNLTAMIHEYIVKRTCYEWVALTLPQAQRQQEELLNEAEMAKGQVKYTLAEPVHPRRQRVTAWGF